MKRKFRLRRLSDFMRVRQTGKSYTHPFLVLTVLPNPDDELRIGVSAGKALGSAVQRNRAKRRLRAAMEPLITTLPKGWDLVLIARKPLLTARFENLCQAVSSLLQRAKLAGFSDQPQ
ncbi:MAG: ribonuclease P protein component [Bellilinea sp.]